MQKSNDNFCQVPTHSTRKLYHFSILAPSNLCGQLQSIFSMKLFIDITEFFVGYMSVNLCC